MNSRLMLYEQELMKKLQLPFCDNELTSVGYNWRATIKKE